MNLSKIFLFAVLALLVVFTGQSEAGWLKKKILKPIEKAGRRVRDGTVQGLAIAQQAANVAATARGAGQPQG